MGVDANSFVGYGIIVNDSLFNYEDVENEDKIFSWSFDEDNYGLSYNYSKADEKGIEIIMEPYSGNWTYIGVPFINKDIDKTIENLKTVKEKFEIAFKELMDTIPESEVSLRETLNKKIPQIIEKSYYS